MKPVESLADELQRHYPSLRNMGRPLPGTTGDQGVRVIEVSGGTQLFEQGKECPGFPLLLGGEVQVVHRSGDGRGLELYRVGDGQVCLVSAASVLSRRPLSAQGTATRTTRLAVIPAPLFDRWQEHAPFRQFVFGVFADRLVDLVTVVDAVAFQRLDQRLAGYLVKAGPRLRVTHQQLADELGTVREMVTRLLNRFEAMGLVSLSREQITVADAPGLRAVAQDGP